jgi:hypothetical protein
MSKKLYPADTLKQAQSILTAWKQIDPALEVGNLSPAALQAQVDTVKELKEKIVHLQLELVELRNQRDDACIGIWGKVKGVRAFMKGTFGDDSIEYKLAGGTPMSEIQRKRRKSSPGQKNEPSALPE